MACYACAWYAQLCGGWNPVRLLLLVQLAFVLLGSSLAVAESDSAYYNYDGLASNQHLAEQVTHVFHTNELDGAVLSRRRRDVEKESSLLVENEPLSTDENENGLEDTVTKVLVQTSLYYNTTITDDAEIAETYWVDMDNNINRRVSEPFDRRDANQTAINLKFEFPFYGLKIRKVGIATSGFLYAGEEARKIHNKNVQYIAPLMANFETSLSNDSRVTYADNGTAFTVEWKGMIIRDKPEAGHFTFQATLHENGDIVFVYSKIPSIKLLRENSDSVRIGVSDAYVTNRTFLLGSRITIFEYDRVNFELEEISEDSVVYLKPMPTCVAMNNCNDCLTKVSHVTCKWCPALQKCSSGRSRFYQQWTEKGCEQANIREQNNCPALQLNVTVSPKPASRNYADYARNLVQNDGTVGNAAIEDNLSVRNNGTKVTAKSNSYYTSTIANDEKLANEYWVNMDNVPDRQFIDPVNPGQNNVFTVDLKFDFPVYGRKIRKIAIATQGYLYTLNEAPAESSIETVQFIAPMMANLSTSLSNASQISYADSGTAFTVEWEEVLHMTHPELGPFTFQVTLRENGDIVFVYRKIPLAIQTLKEDSSPVRIGVSDTYIVPRIIFFVERKTVYEYDRINFHLDEIRNGTSIYLKALPTCFSMDNCNDCLTKVPQMDCKWCPAHRICSTGGPAYRLDWRDNGCEQANINVLDNCPATSTAQAGNLENPASTSRKRRFVPKESPPTAVHDGTSEPPVIKTDPSSVNVTYSTDKVTTIASAMDSANKSPHLPDVNATAKLDGPKLSKNTTIVVSNPMNPVTGQPVHVWANQTRWENATKKPDVKITEKPDPPKPNPPTMSTEEKPNTNGTPGAKASNTTSTDKATVSTTNTTDSDLGDLSISKFSDVTNNTLAQNNITKTEEDTHQYYNSTFFSDENIAKSYWVDMDNHPDRQVNDLLSQSHRRAATVKLKFDFPFYGHKVRNITIATGGFLYTGEYVHSWLAATQYIAPLMANFDTRLSKSSWVKYADNGTAFTVEWEEVVLQDRPEAGGFTFQATLHDNGNIVFVYSKIPLTVEAIEDTAHPVKVGLSDAYIMDRTIFFVRRKTIYEYHRLNFNHQEIQNWTVIYLKALPTCLELTNCNDCLTKVPEFECKWCPDLQQCSTGTFRFRQDWLEKGCEQKNIKEQNSCPATQTSYTDNSDSHNHPGHARSDAGLSANADQNSMRAKGAASPSVLEHPTSNMNMGVSGIIGILVVVTLIAGLVAWAGYAYRNPHSASGQMLIRYRPSQWSWRRGEARYTAATIHM